MISIVVAVLAEVRHVSEDGRRLLEEDFPARLQHQMHQQGALVVGADHHRVLEPVHGRLKDRISAGGVPATALLAQVVVVAQLFGQVLYRHALYYACLGEPFDGKEAVRIGLANMAVPKAKLEAETEKLAEKLGSLMERRAFGAPKGVVT